jgi:hypothetical protein
MGIVTHGKQAFPHEHSSIGVDERRRVGNRAARREA